MGRNSGFMNTIINTAEIPFLPKSDLQIQWNCYQNPNVILNRCEKES
jgi:hypothetical protein